METDQPIEHGVANNDATPDFPAAHSMDSAWWAVDGQGHVALFHTGEAGGMPQECANHEEFDLLDVLSQADFAGLTFYCDDLMAEPDGGFYRCSYATPWDDAANRKLPAELSGHSNGFLVWLKDEQGLAAFAPVTQSDAGLLRRIETFFSRASLRPRARRLPCPGKVIAWLTVDDRRGVDNQTLGRLVSELLAGGTALRAWQYDHSLELERFGFFSYSHDACDNWIAGPLERSAPPHQAVTVDQLPEEAARAVARCKLSRSDFSRDVLVQPFEEVQSYSWGDTWVSAAGHECLRDAPEQGRDQFTMPPANVQPASVHTTLTALLDAWLRGEPGAYEVLNDFLLEASLPVVRDAGSTARRVDEVMETFFTPEELLLLEAEMVQHVQGDCAAISTVIERVRGFAAGQIAADDLKPLAHETLQAWRDFDGEEGPAPQVNRAAWAAFALAMRWPLVAARTVRSLDAGQLNWQIDRILERLEERYGIKPS